jgi:hypothetical protein
VLRRCGIESVWIGVGVVMSRDFVRCEAMMGETPREGKSEPKLVKTLEELCEFPGTITWESVEVVVKVEDIVGMGITSDATEVMVAIETFDRVVVLAPSSSSPVNNDEEVGFLVPTGRAFELEAAVVPLFLLRGLPPAIPSSCNDTPLMGICGTVATGTVARVVAVVVALIALRDLNLSHFLDKARSFQEPLYFVERTLVTSREAVGAKLRRIPSSAILISPLSLQGKVSLHWNDLHSHTNIIS